MLHKCAQCERLTEDVRNWVVAIHYHGTEGLLWVPLAVADPPQLGTSRWVLCGQACATKRFSAWFDEWVHPQNHDPNRPSTLVLQPPLRRDGTAPNPDESEAV